MGNAVKSAQALGSRLALFSTVIESCRVTRRDGSPLDIEAGLAEAVAMLEQVRARPATLYLAGNGGSAAIASHAATDFLNVGGLRAVTLHDSSLLTCMANDYGYAEAFRRVLGTVAQPGDALIAVSSSGKSPNILNAATGMRERGGIVCTFSGFGAENPLRAQGDLNFWLESEDYGMVEIGHQFLLHNLSDRFPGPLNKHHV